MNGMQSEPSPTFSATPDPQTKWKPHGKMVKDEGGMRFMDSYLWATIHDEVNDEYDLGWRMVLLTTFEAASYEGHCRHG